MSGWRKILLRLLLLIPWVLWLWIIVLGVNGDIDGLLAFVLAIILAPVVFGINVVTYTVFVGRRMLKQVKSQTKKEPLKSENYAELPWWDPRKYH